MSRPSSDKERDSLKMAFARAVDALGGGMVVATFTRVKQHALSLYAATQEHERHAGLDVAFDLDKAHVRAGSEPPIAVTWCALLGFSLTPIEHDAGAGEPTLADAAKLDREAFEARAALYDSLADGRLTAREKRRALKELDELASAIAAVRAKVEAA